ncbi:MAG TPA: hypothetical protein VMJ12_04705 [Candidatus Acidoferrales bacterium]|nr:hypothetical protein [Candidatus Acidoferrales bacterium]
MKTSIETNLPKLMKTGFKTRLAIAAAAGVLATLCSVAPAHAGGPPSKQDNKVLQDIVDVLENAQVAELDQLAADFHGALSYHGNITAMMSLWANNSSITFNGAANVGKPAVQAFFQSSGYFLNNWVSLAPEYKTVITVHGDTADISTQCVAVDLSVSPMVVKGVVQVNATCEKIKGRWLFTSMNNTSPAPL